jgi:hypothetical protein
VSTDDILAWLAGDVAQIVDVCRAAGAVVIVHGYPLQRATHPDLPKSYLQRANDVLRRVAHARGVAYVDHDRVFSGLFAYKADYFEPPSCGKHPNAKGYRLMAETLAARIMRSPDLARKLTNGTPLGRCKARPPHRRPSLRGLTRAAHRQFRGGGESAVLPPQSATQCGTRDPNRILDDGMRAERPRMMAAQMQLYRKLCPYYLYDGSFPFEPCRVMLCAHADRVLFLDNCHPLQRGHDVILSAITNAVMELGLLP